MTRWSDGSAGLGGAAWLVTAALAVRNPRLGAIEVLFLLAPLVLVPLALPLVEPAGAGRGPLLRAAVHLQPFGAAAAVASMFMPRGAAAGALAVAWLAVTGPLALHGLSRLAAHGVRDAAEDAISGALLLVPVGGGALVLSRLGAQPLGFVEPIVLLTAVHFHYAGFIAPVLAGLVGRAASPAVRGGRLYRAVVAGAIGGTILLALGITLSPAVEILGAAVLVAALGGLAVLLIDTARRSPNLARYLLSLAAAALVVGAAFALAYAVGEFRGLSLVSLPTMARAHGTVNALGVGLAGLLAFRLGAVERAA
jgi:hypothetical protein